MIRLFFLMVFCALPVQADVVVAQRTIASNSVLSAEDLSLAPRAAGNGFERVEDALGLETKVIIYAGQPILPAVLRMPTLIERNSKVTLVYHNHGLEISTEGRALGRASRGEPVQVLNLSSRNTITGVAAGFGRVVVRPNS